MSEAAGQEELTGEVVAEEPVPLPARAGRSASPALKGEVRTAAIVAAGSALAGAATVAAVRAARSAGTGKKIARHLGRRRPANVVASRSFLVDVHLLDR